MEAIKARVREMEEEAEKLKSMQSEVEKQMNLSTSSMSSTSKYFQLNYIIFMYVLDKMYKICLQNASQKMHYLVFEHWEWHVIVVKNLIQW